MIKKTNKIAATVIALCALVIVNVSVTYAVTSVITISAKVNKGGIIGDLGIHNLTVSFSKEPFADNGHTLGLLHPSMPTSGNTTTAHIYEYSVNWVGLNDGEIFLQANNLKLIKNEEEIDEPEELWSSYLNVKLYFTGSEIANFGTLTSAVKTATSLAFFEVSTNDDINYINIFPAAMSGYLYAVVTLTDAVLSAPSIADKISGAEYTFDVVPTYTPDTE